MSFFGKTVGAPTEAARDSGTRSRGMVEPGRGPRRFVFPWIVSVFAASLALILHLTVRFETIRLGYDVGDRRRDHQALLEKKRLLALEVATLGHVPRVRKIAKYRLEMAAPTTDQIVRLTGRSGDSRSSRWARLVRSRKLRSDAALLERGAKPASRVSDSKGYGPRRSARSATW